MLLFIAGVSKLVAGPSIGDTMLASAWLRYPTGVCEVLIASALVNARTRRGGAIGAACLGLVFSVMAAYELSVDAPRPCGCFGGWIALAPWASLLLAGVIIVLSVRVAGRAPSDGVA